MYKLSVRSKLPKRGSLLIDLVHSQLRVRPNQSYIIDDATYVRNARILTEMAEYLRVEVIARSEKPAVTDAAADVSAEQLPESSDAPNADAQHELRLVEDAHTVVIDDASDDATDDVGDDIVSVEASSEAAGGSDDPPIRRRRGRRAKT
jgi:hypothetical protein